jgi:hypothetical protein
MEATMRVLAITELMAMTRIELCDLAREIEMRLSEFPEGCEARGRALLNLDNIRRELTFRDVVPR